MPTKSGNLSSPQYPASQWVDVSLGLIKNVDDIVPRDPTIAQERAAAADDLLLYTKHTFPSYKDDKFHKHLTRRLTEIVNSGEPHRVMIFAPPQTGKSEIVSTRLPGYWLGHNPELPIGLVSYAAPLAYRNSRLSRAVVQSPAYEDMFPAIRVDPDNNRVTDWHLAGHKGFCMAVGVGGPITGHGFGAIVVDDPIENWAAAQSETLRESTWDWWNGTLKTRLWEGYSIFFMMTRWHEDDIAGRILDQEGRIEEGGKWEVLSYTALCEEPETDILGREYGEALAPSRFSAEYMRSLRDEMVPQVWSAEYMQNPLPPTGDFFKIGRIDIVESVPVGMCRIIQGVPVSLQQPAVRYWDFAATEKKVSKRDPDATSGTLMAQANSETDKRFYVLDNINVRFGPDQVEALVVQTAKLDGPKVRIRIEQEPGASGVMVINHYKKLLAGYDVEGVPSSGDKRMKAGPYATQVNIGNVVFLKAEWNKPVLAEMGNFPHARHDDDVDSGAGAFNDLTLGGDQWRDVEFKSV